VAHYIRYRSGDSACYGLLEGDTVREIRGDIFGEYTETVAALNLSDVALLHPCEPSKIVCVGLNYRSHLGTRPEPKTPEIFFKPVSCLQDPEGPIVTPQDSIDMHYEGELVIVIGRQTRKVSVEKARDSIFGVTCGNDVSERNWQHGAGKDMQWWRAKGCDTFGPLGPSIVTGLDYDTLLLRTRLNGETVQKQYTSDLIFDCPTIVSYISQWITLMPGDVIYTGTPGATRKLTPGDVVEVEIEGVGTLRNPVT
jgi:2-keto-4-pentenoate hydratase/2-oxohepta-3-ene-1,7-dioic acid hydratase in catechol pathway